MPYFYRLGLALFLFAFALPIFGQAIRSDSGCRAAFLQRNDDGSSGVVTIGFNINLFGKQRASLYVNNNGNLTFDSPLSAYSPDPIRQIRNEMITAFWADVDTSGLLSNLVTYGNTTIEGRRAFCRNYVNVGYYDANDDRLNSFQIVLVDRSDTGSGNFDIAFNYERILWETGDASGGTNGFGGVSGRVGYTNGTGLADTSFELPGSGVRGDFLDSSSNALVRRFLSSNIPGRLLFPVRNGVLRSSITANPISLVLRASGSTPVYPPAQSLSISSNGGQVQYNLVKASASNGGNWLSASNLGTGFTPGTLTVRATVGALTRGTYIGEIFVQPVDQNIPLLRFP